MTDREDSGRPLDVDALMADLAQRARATGAEESLFQTPPGEYEIRPNPTVPVSTRAVVGPVITRGRASMVKALMPTLDDLATQVTAALDDLTRLQDDIRALQDQAGAMQSMAAETAALAGRLRDIEDLAVAARLARLEALSGTDPVLPTEPLPDPGAISPGIASLAIERSRIDNTGEERLGAYWSVLDPGAAVLDLSGGSNTASLESHGFAVRKAAGDPLTALGAAEAGTVGGIVAIEVADHLTPEHWLAFAPTAHAALRDGGGVVIEVINSTTPAGLALRSRIPGLPAPTHPETIAFLLRAAGFRDVEVRYLGEFPADQRAPVRPDPDWFEQRLNDLALVINRLVVGQPIAAVLARR